ncbi:MAG: hypothetical protein A2V62_02740 [Nitrospirae bacterium RBG_19FT_COMBO_58_9]|nr:MAG: hypothetical protein A2V62_02740 [Nitrospirae bacterium RBG_19FT_COMBO_58_9]
MVVGPGTLDIHIRYLLNRFDLVSLADLAGHQHIDVHKKQKKPLCVLTFDDGWCDFYKYAYPILRKHAAPATVFLPTDYIGTNRWFWTDRVGHLLERISQSRKGEGWTSFFRDSPLRDVVSMPGSHETKLERVIGHLKTYRIDKIEQILSELSAVSGEESTPGFRAFLTWGEVREMHESSLVSFGSHTAGHPLLTTLTEDEAQHELRKSMDALLSNKVVTSEFISFSYPNGNHSERLSDMVREAGYHLAVTTQNGWNHQGANPYTLKRISVHQDMAATQAMLAARIVNSF